MSELISGKEALIALANGAEVEYKTTDNAGSKWHQAKMLTVNTIMNFDDACILFRLKPHTITINGVEVPAPFNGELSHKQYAYVLNTASPDGYGHIKFYEGNAKPLACWICEDEIKQVVAALRSVFKPQ